MIHIHPTMRGHVGVALCFARCGRGILGRRRMAVHLVASFQTIVGSLTAFDGDKRGFHRDSDDGKDVDRVCDRGSA